MLDVYCIPGMGVDERLFKNLRLNNCLIHHIRWITPIKQDTMPSYASRLAEQIDSSKPFALIGVSLGGMCAVEISKNLNPVKVFVVSSCKTNDELPQKLTIWKGMQLYRFLSDRIFIAGAMLMKKQFGVTGAEQTKEFLAMLRTAPANYYGRAVHYIMSWKNTQVLPSVIHIHGTADRILPLRKIKECNYIIEGGSHFMIVDRAEEISRIINKELTEIIGENTA